VIDFIHLSEAENIARLLDALKVATPKAGCEPDPRHVGVRPGEMTRKRIRDPLAKRITEDCRRCDGHGRRKTVETVAVEVLRRVERAAAAAPGKPTRYEPRR